MADISKRFPDCESDGERGPRGRRGPTGATGPAGAAGASAGVQLKFSGIVSVGSPDQTTHLGDSGLVITSPEPLVLEYPVAQPGTLKDLAANIQPPVLLTVGTIVVQLFLNGAPVPGFLLTWVPGETTGVKSIVTSALPVVTEDLIDLQFIITDIEETDSFIVSATIGSGT